MRTRSPRKALVTVRQLRQESGDNGQSGGRVGRFAEACRHEAGLLAKNHVSQQGPKADGEDKGDDLAFRQIEKRQLFFRAAGTAAPENGNTTLFVSAAVGEL